MFFLSLFINVRIDQILVLTGDNFDWLRLLGFIILSVFTILLPLILIFNYVLVIANDDLDKPFSKIEKFLFNKPIPIKYYKWLILLGVMVALIILANLDISSLELSDVNYSSKYYATLSAYHVIIASIFIPWALHDNRLKETI
jgi:hypothetical protein